MWKKCGIARNIQSHFFLLFDLLISSNLKMPLKEDSINYFFFLKDKPYLFINYNKRKNSTTDLINSDDKFKK